MCLPNLILNIKKDVPEIDTSKTKGAKLDYSLCYHAWYENAPSTWLVITCLNDQIASRVVGAFYDRANRTKGFPAPRKVVRRGAVVYLLRGEHNGN